MKKTFLCINTKEETIKGDMDRLFQQQMERLFHVNHLQCLEKYKQTGKLRRKYVQQIMVKELYLLYIMSSYEIIRRKENMVT